MTKKQIKEETYSTLKKKHGIEKETDAFTEHFEELSEKAESSTRKYFKNRLDRVQMQIIINKVPGVIYFIMMTANDRLEQSQRWREFHIDLYKNWKYKISQILNDEYLTDILGINREKWKNKKDQLNIDLKHSKKTRAGYNKDLEFVLRPVFIMLKGFQVSQRDQINFIYALFKEFGHKEYGGYLEKGTRDRIRNMQENAINSLKIDL
jgi:hypothetical protein